MNETIHHSGDASHSYAAKTSIALTVIRILLFIGSITIQVYIFLQLSSSYGELYNPKGLWIIMYLLLLVIFIGTLHTNWYAIFIDTMRVSFDSHKVIFYYTLLGRTREYCWQDFEGYTQAKKGKILSVHFHLTNNRIDFNSLRKSDQDKLIAILKNYPIADLGWKQPRKQED